MVQVSQSAHEARQTFVSMNCYLWTTQTYHVNFIPQGSSLERTKQQHVRRAAAVLADGLESKVIGAADQFSLEEINIVTP